MFHQIEMERWWYLTLRAFVHIKGDPICEALTAWKHLASADSEQGTLAFNCSCRQCLAPPPDVSTFKSQTLPLKLIQQILNEQLVKILLVNATILSWLILIFFFSLRVHGQCPVVLLNCLALFFILNSFQYFQILRYHMYSAVDHFLFLHLCWSNSVTNLALAGSWDGDSWSPDEAKWR